MKYTLSVLLLSALLLSALAPGCSDSSTNTTGGTQRLWVPHFNDKLVRGYVLPYSAGTVPLTVAVPVSLIDANASPNAVAFYKDEMFVTLTTNDGASGGVLRYSAAAVQGTAQPTAIKAPDSRGLIGIAFDASGNMYVCGGDHITRFSAPAYTATVDMNAPVNTAVLSGMTFDAAGNLWVADYISDVVMKYNAADLAASPQTAIPRIVNGAAAQPGRLSRPEGLAFAAGNLWIANNNDNQKNPEGTVVTFSQAQLAALSGAGPFTVTGTQYALPRPAAKPAEPAQPGGLAVKDNLLFVHEQIEGQVLIYNLNNMAASPVITDIPASNPGFGGMAVH